MNMNIWNSYIWTADKDRIICRSSQWRCFNLHVGGWNTLAKVFWEISLKKCKEFKVNSYSMRVKTN